MPARNPKEVFLLLLSEVRNRTERQSEVYQEIAKHADEPECSGNWRTASWHTLLRGPVKQEALPKDQRSNSNAASARKRALQSHPKKLIDCGVLALLTLAASFAGA